MKTMKDFPTVYLAIRADRAIRVIDARWSGGFVDAHELSECIEKGILRVEVRDGMRFAVSATMKDEGER
jgi:hypothetical protein